MISLTLMIGVLGLLFIMAYATSRRFGVMGLALAAGSLLSTHFSGILTLFVQQQGFVLASPPIATVVAALLILAPPMVLLFSGPSYSATWQRVLGALAFALLGLTFLIEPIIGALHLDGIGLTVIGFIHKYASIIIVVGIAAANLDALLTGKPARKKPSH